MGNDGEALALQSIAEVITEARALVRDSGGLDYNQALIDLTMARLQPDVKFLILGADEPAPTNGQSKVSVTGDMAEGKPVKDKLPPKPAGYVSDGSRGQGGTVRHLDPDCARLGYHGYHPATPKEIRTLRLCLRCRD